MNDDIPGSILFLTGFSLSTPPVGYLGLPLFSSKLNSRDCVPLVDRFCANIEAWSCRFLNFSGRLQLSKIILLGISGFWSMIYSSPSRYLFTHF